MNIYDTETIDGLTVKYYYDDDSGMPWENDDSHGTVRTSNNPHNKYRGDKKTGERPLNSPERHECQYYYDWQGAMKIAKRDGWAVAPNQVHQSVQADFDFLRGYLRGNWVYVGIVVEDANDKELASLWCVETFNDYHKVQAREIVSHCMDNKRRAWREALREARERKYWALRGIETVGV